MAKAKARRVQSSEERPGFDAKAFLESAGAARRVVSYPKGKIVFSQSQPSDAVMYIQKGSIKISVLSRTGKEAVVAMLGPGDFFGEGALTGQSIRIGTATAATPTTVLIIEKAVMLQLLRDEPTFSDQCQRPVRAGMDRGDPRRHQVTEWPPSEVGMTAYRCHRVPGRGCGRTRRRCGPTRCSGRSARRALRGLPI